MVDIIITNLGLIGIAVLSIAAGIGIAMIIDKAPHSINDKNPFDGDG